MGGIMPLAGVVAPSDTVGVLSCPRGVMSEPSHKTASNQAGAYSPDVAQGASQVPSADMATIGAVLARLQPLFEHKYGEVAKESRGKLSLAFVIALVDSDGHTFYPNNTAGAEQPRLTSRAGTCTLVSSSRSLAAL